MPLHLVPRHQERPTGRVVYVVDDEESIAVTLAAIIKTKGHDARNFTHPLEALEAARSLAPDLLISDVFMPEMNGVELATRMSQMCPDCKVLLLSGQPLNREVFEKARNKGYSFSLARKPLQPTVLLDSLDRLFLTDPPRAET
jgi:DNA-binding NtrC family response regulator